MISIDKAQHVWVTIICMTPEDGIYSEASRNKEIKAWKHRLNQIAQAQGRALPEVTGRGYMIGTDERSVIRVEDGTVIKVCSDYDAASDLINTLWEDET